MFQGKYHLGGQNSCSMDLNNSLGNTIRHNTTKNKSSQKTDIYHFENNYLNFLLEVVCFKIVTELFSCKCQSSNMFGVCESYVG